MRFAPTLACTTLLLAALGCTAAPRTDTAKEEAAIRQLVTDWNGYLAARNDSAIAALYASDGVMLPPNMPRVSGTEAIRAFWAELWKMNATLSLAPVSVRVAPSGDLAVEEGNWDIAMGDQKDHGKYLVTWSKAGGGWKVVQDIWNSDQPPALPAAAAPAKGR